MNSLDGWITVGKAGKPLKPVAVKPMNAPAACKLAAAQKPMALAASAPKAAPAHVLQAAPSACGAAKDAPKTDWEVRRDLDPEARKFMWKKKTGDKSVEARYLLSAGTCCTPMGA